MTAIRLRAIEPEDVDFIYACEEDRQSARWSDNRAPFSRNQLAAYALTYDADPFSAGQLRLIIDNQMGERVGILDLYDISEKDSRATIGICIHPHHRKKGLASRALEALLRFNRERLGLRQLTAKVSTENEEGLRLFEKNGFKKIALLPEWHKIGGKFHDFVLFRTAFD